MSGGSRVPRRDFLTSAVAGGSVLLAGCGGDSGDEETPATLERAFFVVEPPMEGDTTADIRYALEYGEEPDASQISPEDTLLTDGTVVHDDSISLNWNDSCSSDQYDDAVSGTSLQSMSAHSQFDDTLDDGLDESVTFFGRIEAAVDLATPVYSSGRCSIPSIEYSEEEVSEDDGIVRFQVHDGYNYQFPRSEPSFSHDARYDIQVEDRTLQNVGQNDRTIQFGANVPASTNSTELVPSFEHRAQPLIGTLQSLAQRRSAVLDKTARGMTADLRANAQPIEENAEKIVDRLNSAAVDAVGLVGPADPQDPADILTAVGRQFAPLAIGALAGPPGVAIGLAVATTASIYGTTSGLNSYANSYTGDFRDHSVIDEFFDTSGGGWLTPIYRENENYCTGEQCTSEPSTTIHAVVSVTEFHQQFGTMALATGESFQTEAEHYRTTLEEMKRHIEYFDQRLDNEVLKKFIGYNNWQDFKRGTETALSVVEQELALLTQLVETVNSRQSGIVEYWRDESIEQSVAPHWNEQRLSEQFDASINAELDHLEITCSDGGEGRVSVPAEYTGWGETWQLRGLFKISDMSGPFEHSLIVATSTDAVDLRIPLGLDDGSYQFTLGGSLIQQSESESVTLDPSTWYRFELLHLGGGEYWAILASGETTHAYISASGSSPGSNEYGVRYRTFANGNAQMSHEHLVWNRNWTRPVPQ